MSLNTLLHLHKAINKLQWIFNCLLIWDTITINMLLLLRDINSRLNIRFFSLNSKWDRMTLTKRTIIMQTSSIKETIIFNIYLHSDLLAFSKMLNKITLEETMVNSKIIFLRIDSATSSHNKILRWLVRLVPLRRQQIALRVFTLTLTILEINFKGRRLSQRLRLSKSSRCFSLLLVACFLNLSKIQTNSRTMTAVLSIVPLV